MWHSCGADDVKIRRKQTPSLQIHQSIVSRSAQKQRWWKIINTLLCRWEIRLKLFRRIISVHQLSVYGAVSDLCDECKSCPVRTGRFVLVRQSAPLFVPTSVMKTLTSSTDDPAPEGLLQKYQERVDNKIVWLSCVLMQDSWQRLTSDSTSRQRTLKSSHNLQNQ